MSPEQLIQLKAMSYDERVAKYKPLRNAGRVSLKDYAYIIYSLPYTSLEEAPGEVRAEIRQSGVERGGLGEGTQDGGNADEPISQESFITPLEQHDKSVLSGCADVQPKLDINRASEDKAGSQKERLLRMLQDGQWHDTPSIQREVYGADHLGVARIGARADDLRNDGHTIESKKVSKSVWSYRLKIDDVFYGG